MNGGVLFRDRAAAGRSLAERLRAVAPGLAERGDLVVLGLARGGVPVADEVARAFRAPLDVMVVRKLGAPHQPELAVGAVAGESTVLNPDVLAEVELSPSRLDDMVSAAHDEASRLEAELRGGAPALPLAGRTVVLVDDGLATGASLRAAALEARRRGAARVVAAVPVASAEASAELGGIVDRVVCVFLPFPFYAVGQWYGAFPQVGDAEVKRLLEAARRRAGPRAA